MLLERKLARVWLEGRDLQAARKLGDQVPQRYSGSLYPKSVGIELDSHSREEVSI